LSYSLQPFDPSIVSLPPHFRGNNAAEIYARLAKRQQSLRQGEFETSEVYRQRKQQELSKPLLGSLTQQGIFAFVVNNVESKYDADQQILHVRAKLSNVIEGVTFRNKTLALPWLKVSRDMGSYIGTNAFGARIRVDRAVVDSYVIAFDNYQQFYQQPRIERSETASDYLRDKKEQVLWEQTLSDQMFAADLKMGVDSAMKGKENVRLLLVCRVAPPYTIKGVMYDKPTVDDPHDFLFEYYSLNTELIEVWFFDSSVGAYTRNRSLKLRVQLSHSPMPKSIRLESTSQTRYLRRLGF